MQGLDCWISAWKTTLECDLIEYIVGERMFKTTPKGMQVLQTYNKMDELLVRAHQV